jgi:hypothetical protein
LDDGLSLILSGRHLDGNISKPIEIVAMVFEIGSKKVVKFG